VRNSITGVLIASMTVTAVIMSNLVYGSMWLSAATFVGLALGYVAIYVRMVRHRWCFRIGF
jgi:hypothetical protein